MTTINNVAGIKGAFRSAQEENYEEERSRASRRSNIIVYGVAEETTELTDDLRVKKLLEDTHTKASAQNIAHLGKVVEGRCSPIKVVLGNEKEINYYSNSLMTNLSALKNNESYKEITDTE